ncbi:histidine kinase [Anaerosporomusa subterranea]|uniref:histidine kinase n=1 Tax=Anaerosporomusa subterranea TaxID=1794912 RepID=A0A154BLN2_ANASB|nr:HAMP domain-containing sensor histidine kinase [Anaerosporomusa subterranea]KYZ74884.1 histidine kinase [Anaerosporomusa subterranea]
MSITYRYSLLMSLLITITVLMLTYFANYQMETHFREYLVERQIYISQNPDGITTIDMVMGPIELTMLSSVHQSLLWIGIGMIIVGLAASYVLARDITVPLRKLNLGAQAVASGQYDYQVPVVTNDEVGQLAGAFNQMSKSLAENQVLRQKLFVDIAHEMKTPLAIIQGNLEGILDGVIEANPDQIKSLLEETVHLNRIIVDLRDLSLAEAGQLVLEKTPTDINTLISRSVQMLQPLAEDKQVALKQMLGAVPELQVDAGRMIQVIYNLLTNAIRYTPENGLVTISSSQVSEKGADWVRIQVQDTGIGMKAEDLSFVFNHFYRADASRDRKSGGAGLGLAIVKQLVERHQGYVTVSSVLGQGSLFEVYLPHKS